MKASINLLIATLILSTKAYAPPERHFFDTADLKVADIFADQGLSQDAEFFPYNQLTRAEVAGAVQRYRRPIESNDYALAQLGVNSKIGGITGITGPSLSYPFGGVDLGNSFSLSDDIEDVFSQGLEGFGSLGELIALSSEAEDWNWAVRDVGLGNFDSIRGTAIFMSQGGLSGLGAQALIRGIHLLGWQPVGLYFFRISDKGRATLIRTADSALDDQQSNYVWVFRNPETGKIKRFWLAPYHLNEGENGVFKFFQNLRFSSLLIKGVPALFDDPDHDPAHVARYALDPAKRNHARVISDRAMDRTPGLIRAIWSMDAAPPSIYTLGPEERFGYGHPGNPVFYGNSDQLAGSSTPRSRIRGGALERSVTCVSWSERLRWWLANLLAGQRARRP